MNLKRPALCSLGLHILVIVLVALGVPHFSKKAPLSPSVLPIEVVKIAPKTQVPLKVLEKKPHLPAELPKSAPKMPPKVQPVKTPVPPVLPLAIPDKPKPVAKPVVKKVPQETLEPTPPQKKKPVEQKPSKAKPQEDDFMSILNSLEKMPVAREDKGKAKNVPAKAAGESIADTLSMSELDALRAQLSRCWALPAGARDAEGLVVELKVIMNPDATVQHTQIVDEGRMTKDPFFQTAAESARRALLDPACSPLKLPADKYHEWREFRITFNPREMF